MFESGCVTPAAGLGDKNRAELRPPRGRSRAGTPATASRWSDTRRAARRALGRRAGAAYAPELRVRAVAASAPGANLEAIARDRYHAPETTLNVLAAVASWHQVYGAPVDRVLTPAGRRAIEQIAADRRHEVDPHAEPFRSDALGAAPWPRLMRPNTPGSRRTPAPILLLVGTADRQVPPHTNLAFARRLRRTGDDVRLRLLDGADHDRTFVEGREAMLALLRERLSPR